MLSERLKTLRKNAGFTNKDMAEKLNCSISGYNKYENGITKPSWNRMKDISNILNVSFLELTGEPLESKTWENPENTEHFLRQNKSCIDSILSSLYEISLESDNSVKKSLLLSKTQNILELLGDLLKSHQQNNDSDKTTQNIQVELFKQILNFKK